MNMTCSQNVEQLIILYKPPSAHTACLQLQMNLHLQMNQTLPLQLLHWQVHLTSSPRCYLEEPAANHSHTASTGTFRHLKQHLSFTKLAYVTSAPFKIYADILTFYKATSNSAALN